MTTNFILISTCLQFFIFTIYLLSSLIRFGITESISATYYLQKTWIGQLWFTFTLFAIGFLLLPFLSFENTWSFLIFFGGAGVISTGLAAAYKNTQIGKIHVVSILIGIFSALIGIWIIFDLWIPLAIVGLSGILMKIFKIKNETWWIETIAFYSINLSLLIKFIL